MEISPAPPTHKIAQTSIAGTGTSARQPGPQGRQGHPWAHSELPAPTTNRRHNSPRGSCRANLAPQGKESSTWQRCPPTLASWHPRSQGWGLMALAGAWPPSASAPNCCLLELLCEHLLLASLRPALCLNPCTPHPVGMGWSGTLEGLLSGQWPLTA